MASTNRGCDQNAQTHHTWLACADAAVRKASKGVPPSNSSHFTAANLPVMGIGGWLHPSSSSLSADDTEGADR